MIKRSAYIILLILIVSQINSQTITLPVSQQLVTKLSLSVQKLEDLLIYFGTRSENKFEIYKRVMITRSYLDQLSRALAQFNNVIAGSGNTVNGTKNIVIGNFNNINGNNNWVFISQFTGKANGQLLVGQWRIQLQKCNLILINTRLAISFLDEEKNKGLKKKYSSKNRQFCRWDKWTNPKNQKSNKHWQKYEGYKDWKTTKYQQDSRKQERNWSRSRQGSWGGVLGGNLGGNNWGR